MAVADEHRKYIEGIMPELIEKDKWLTWHSIWRESKGKMRPEYTNILPQEVQAVAERLGYQWRDVKLPHSDNRTIRAYSDELEKIPTKLSQEDYFWICNCVMDIRSALRQRPFR
jgi:hypothetical protein